MTTQEVAARCYGMACVKKGRHYKGRPRVSPEEIVVIEMKNGKIVSETFFY